MVKTSWSLVPVLGSLSCLATRNSFVTVNAEPSPYARHLQLDSNSDSCGNSLRVRKAWRMMSEDEKNKYKNALSSAMKSGEFFEFTKLHLERMSERQAHQTCAFLIWHKRFLLAYENMLRDQSPESACVTIPYWDAMTEHAEMIDGRCSNIYDCAPIVRELGGEPQKVDSITLDQRDFSGVCYNGFKDYCDENGKCGCLPRGDLKTSKLPSGVGYQGLFKQISFSNSFEEFSHALQSGAHNEMHGKVGGIMSTFSSPSDPLFWSWHATIDMMLFIYHRCHVPASMSKDEMKASIYGFSQDGECRYGNDAPDAKISGKLIQQGEGATTAEKNPKIGKYFKDLADNIGDLIGFHTLDQHSYEYQIPQAFKKYVLHDKNSCQGFAQTVEEIKKNPPTQPPTPAPTPSATPSASPVATPMATPKKPGSVTPPMNPSASPKAVTKAPAATKNGTRVPSSAQPGNKGSFSGSGSQLGAATVGQDDSDSNDHDDDDDSMSTSGNLDGAVKSLTPVMNTSINAPPSAPPSKAPVPIGSGSSSGSSWTTIEVQATNRSGIFAPVNEGDVSLIDGKYWQWFMKTTEELKRLFPGNFTEVSNQREVLECVSFNEEFGIDDFSEEFKKEFRINQTRPNCKKQVDEVKEGAKKVVLEVQSFKPEEVVPKPDVTPAPPVQVQTKYDGFGIEGKDYKKGNDDDDDGDHLDCDMDSDDSEGDEESDVSGKVEAFSENAAKSTSNKAKQESSSSSIATMHAAMLVGMFIAAVTNNF